MMAMPAATPVTMPVVALTVAFVGERLVHVPPGALLVSVMVWPTHTTEGPPMEPGVPVTVTILVAVHPATE